MIAVSHAAILDINRRLFVELAQRGHRVLLAVPSHWNNDFGSCPLQPEPLAHPSDKRLLLRVCRLVMAGKTALQLYLPGSWPMLARWRPNIVFIDEEPWSFAALQWVLCAKLARASIIVYTKENRERSYPVPFSWIRHIVLRSAGHILAISDDAVRILSLDGYDMKSSIFPHAVDTAIFHKREDDERTSNDRPFRIGFVGRIAPEKGLDTLLRAIALLVAESKNASTIVTHIYGAGDEAYTAELRQLEQSLGILAGLIRWHGAVPHDRVPDAMRSLDALVIPTVAYQGYKEQFGRVVIEALACGVPVMTSDNGELPALARKTGGGLVFPEGNASALADCLTVAMRERKALADMAQHGYDYVLGHYTYGMLATRLEEIMQRVTTPSSVHTHGGCAREDR